MADSWAGSGPSIRDVEPSPSQSRGQGRPWTAEEILLWAALAFFVLSVAALSTLAKMDSGGPAPASPLEMTAQSEAVASGSAERVGQTETVGEEKGQAEDLPSIWAPLWLWAFLSLTSVLAWKAGRSSRQPVEESSESPNLSTPGQDAASAYVENLEGTEADPPSIYLETMVLFMLGSLVIGALVGFLMTPGRFWPLWLQWGLFAVFLWPMLRGVDVKRFRVAVGWIPGRGFQEALWGLAAYMVSLPLLGLGVAASVCISKHWLPGSHPLGDWMATATGWDFLTLLVVAVVWAPLAEEMAFRGVFFHYLRSRTGMWGAAGLSALVFALLHPQGPAGWPFLMTFGILLAVAREWTGSLTASLTMHCVHNGVMLALASHLMR